MLYRPGGDAWLCACFVLLGCQSTIAIGSECPSFGVPCPVKVPPDPDPFGRDAGPVVLDGGADAAASEGDASRPLEDAAVKDAEAPADDGMVDAALPVLVDNPSFEGPAGDVLPVAATSLPSWEACAGNVSVVESATVGTFSGSPSTITPTEGDTFLELAIIATGPGAILQTLSEPLAAGTPQAFLVDVAREGIGTARLQLRSGRSSCAFGATLSQTEAIANDGAFHTECLSFTPDQDVAELVLALSANVTGISIYVDNLRRVASCM